MKLLMRASLGGMAGLVATFAMDFAGTIIWERWTPQHARDREREVEPKFPLAVLGERIAEKLDRHPIEKTGEAISSALHWGIGFVCGALHGLIEQRVSAQRNMLGQPIAMAMLTLDEFGFPAAGLCPPPSAFPRETHIRAAVSHVVYGLTLACVYGALRGLAESQMSE